VVECLPSKCNTAKIILIKGTCLELHLKATYFMHFIPFGLQDSLAEKPYLLLHKRGKLRLELFKKET
jgi:hypothetical protein